MRRFRDERGATAVLVAGAMLFLFGAAALAVDTSIFYGDARTNQTTADLACLAGVIEGDTNDKIDAAADIAAQNWPSMQGQSVTVTGNIGTMSDGTSQVMFEANYGGDANKMRVRVLESADTNFARALGAGTVNITQEAVCEAQPGGGFGGLPFGIDIGGYDGYLQSPPPCKDNPGNCNPLDIPRDDTNGTKEKLVRNSTLGPDRELSWHHGLRTDPGSPSGLQATACTDVSAGNECHVVKTDTGVSAAHLGEAMEGRLQAKASSTCTWRGGLDCTPLATALGGAPQPLISLGTKPTWFDTSLHGPWTAANLTDHVYYNGTGVDCSLPRWGQAPLVSANLDWESGDPFQKYNGKDTLKIVEFVTVYITVPTNTNDTFYGSNNLQQLGATIVWFGPDAMCSNGAKLPPPGQDVPAAIKLIEG